MASLSTDAAAAAAAAEAAGSSALEDEIAKAIKEGKGWKKGEREAYLKKVLEEDHPMFAENIEVGGCGCGAIRAWLTTADNHTPEHDLVPAGGAGWSCSVRFAAEGLR